MRLPLSPSNYRHGWGATGLAGTYLVVAALLVAAAAREAQAGGGGDGSFLSGFAFMATFPLSLVVVLAYMAIESARGVPMADQDGGLGLLVGYALCAPVNAYLIWMVLRGPDRKAVRPAQA